MKSFSAASNAIQQQKRTEKYLRKRKTLIFEIFFENLKLLSKCIHYLSKLKLLIKYNYDVNRIGCCIVQAKIYTTKLSNAKIGR